MKRSFLLVSFLFVCYFTFSPLASFLLVLFCFFFSCSSFFEQTSTRSKDFFFLFTHGPNSYYFILHPISFRYELASAFIVRNEDAHLFEQKAHGGELPGRRDGGKNFRSSMLISRTWGIENGDSGFYASFK